MAAQEKLTDIPDAQVAGIVASYREIGATVQVVPQGAGLFTVIATFPDAVHTTPFATKDLAETVAPVPAGPAAPLPPVVTSTDFAARSPQYLAWFDACECNADRVAAVQARADRLLANAARYKAVGVELQIPWYFIGIIHSLESNLNFATHLHNGDPLTARTVRVPAGYPKTGNPPFTWEQSAKDAMLLKGFGGQADWGVSRMLYRWEGYNGFGYSIRGLSTPYLWSFSQLYTKGRFVADHVFDPDAVSAQCGAAVLLKALQARL